MHTTLPLATRGRSPYVIVLPRDAIPAERQAAAELQSFFHQITGARLPIQDDAAPLPGAAILLGPNAHLARLNLPSKVQAPGPEGFTLGTRGPHLIIVGGRPRGTLYGVYTFLEDHLGCRWFSPTVSRIPRQPTLHLAPFHAKQAPALEYREPFWFEAFDADWCARNKVNSANARLDERRGGKTIYAGFVHTFYALVPPERYFKRHPEYFALVNGRRIGANGQLCLTNPNVLPIAIESVKELLRRTPEANIVSVSQNDGGGWCECERCRRVEAEEGGTPAGPIIRFVNAVAEAIEPEFPQVAVDTLAYFYSRRPVTRTRPRPNVIVRLCTIECCFAHPLAAEDISFRHDLVGWSRMSRRLYIWNYATDFSHYVIPQLNLTTIQPNLQFFVTHGVKGVFEQGAYQSTGGEMAAFKAYLQAKVLWDPHTDVARHRREFMAAFYGPAAGAIERYLHLLYGHARRTGFHEQIYTAPDAGYLPPALLEKAQRIFDAAERAVACDPAALQRVRVARLGVQYAQLWRTDSAGPWQLRGARYAPVNPAPLTSMARRFFAVCTREGVTHLNEHGLHPKTFRRTIAERLRGVRLVTLANCALRLRLAPALGGRIVAIERHGENRNLAALPDETAPNFPYAGGYAERIGYALAAPGDRMAFEIIGRPTSRRIALAATFGNSLRLTRTIRLHPTAPVWTIRSVLTNKGTQSQPVCLRTRLCLALGDDTDRVESDGQTWPLTPHDDTQQGCVGIPGRRIAASGWQLAGPAGNLITGSAQGPLARALFIRQADDATVSIQLITRPQILRRRQVLALLATYGVEPAAKRPPANNRHAPNAWDIWSDEFRLLPDSRRVAVIEDSSAPDGFAIRIRGDDTDQAHRWNFDPARLGLAIRWNFDPERFPANAEYEVSAVIRAEIEGRRGPACAFGVYDHFQQKNICRGTLAAARASTGWQTVRLGRFRPHGNLQYVWIALSGNVRHIPAIFVNRLRLRQVRG